MSVCLSLKIKVTTALNRLDSNLQGIYHPQPSQKTKNPRQLFKPIRLSIGNALFLYYVVTWSSCLMFAVLFRKGGDIVLFITLVPKVL